MRRAVERIDAGHWPTGKSVGTVTLAFQDRHRRRIRMADDTGEPFMLDLTEAEHLHDGDGLRLENGDVIEVRSAVEAVLDIQCEDMFHASRVAWHIGNRHIPMQVLDSGKLRIQADHVLADMLRGLGAQVSEIEAAFSPEPGAYAGGGHSHGHGGHGHEH